MSAAEVSPPRAGADRESEPVQIRWAALGDSFTAGTTPDERTWTTLVHSQLAGLADAELLNLARVGARTEELEREQLPVALASGPTLISLICGGNDVIGSVRPALGGFRSDLDRIYGRVRTELPGAAVLTATYPAVGSHAVRPRTRRRIVAGLEELNEIIREAAARHRFTCVELADHPGRADLSNYAEDGLHPSPAGHREAAAVFGPVIQELIGPIGEEQQ